METLDKRVCKETLRATSQRAEVRWVKHTGLYSIVISRTDIVM